MKKQRKAGVILLWIALAFIIIIVDQLTKKAAVSFLKGQPSRVWIPGVFQLTYTENTGAAFSMLENQLWFFILIALVFGVLMLYFIIRLSGLKSKGAVISSLCCALVLGGSIGNLIDRILYGYVIDFFDFCLIHFAIFNVADCAITIAAFVFVLFVMLPKGRLDELEKEWSGGNEEN